MVYSNNLIKPNCNGIINRLNGHGHVCTSVKIFAVDLKLKNNKTRHHGLIVPVARQYRIVWYRYYINVYQIVEVIILSKIILLP